MPNKTLWIGMDVGAKSFYAALDFPAVFPTQEAASANEMESREFKMTTAGVKALCHWINLKQEEFFANYSAKDEEPLPMKFVMEATGICSTRLEKILLTVCPDAIILIANPEPVSAFQKSLNVKNKTDKSDAQVIARYGKERNPSSQLKLSAEFPKLRDLSRARSFLKDQRTALKNYHSNIDSSLPKRMCSQIINTIDKEINGLDREIDRLEMADSTIKHEVEIMCAMPGIGVASAVAILGELGSLTGYATRAKISAMSGLNPMRKQSGTSVNQTRISRKGSPVVRRFLYMDSKTALPRIPVLQALYDIILTKGNTRMQARCAVMRKMLLFLRGMVIANEPFNKNYKKIDDLS